MTPAPTAKIVKDAWGDTPPPWIRALRDEVILSTQNQVAKRLGYTAGVINGALRGTYNNGNLEGVEERVRRVLMREVVACPVLGEIERVTCAEWCAKTEAFVSSNPLRVRMFRACTKCPQNSSKRSPNEQ